LNVVSCSLVLATGRILGLFLFLLRKFKESLKNILYVLAEGALILLNIDYLSVIESSYKAVVKISS
jgi:hypothetical protein